MAGLVSFRQIYNTAYENSLAIVWHTTTLRPEWVSYPQQGYLTCELQSLSQLIPFHHRFL